MQVMVFFEPLVNRQLQRKLILQRLFQSGNIPLLIKTAGRHIFTDQIPEDIPADRVDNL